MNFGNFEDILQSPLLAQAPAPETLSRSNSSAGTPEPIELAPTMTQTGTPSPGASAILPVKPKLGGIHGDAAWIGGPPLADFSGPYAKRRPTPLCVRGISNYSDLKGYIARTTGREHKFKRDDPDYGLMAFANDALHHMRNNGMDTIFYMQGVDDKGNGGQELFTYHTRYTKAAVEKFVSEMLDKSVFDEHQEEALEELALW